MAKLPVVFVSQNPFPAFFAGRCAKFGVLSLLTVLLSACGGPSGNGSTSSSSSTSSASSSSSTSSASSSSAGVADITIATQPGSATVRVTAAVTATVVASGGTALTYKWRHDGVVLTDHPAGTGTSGVSGSMSAGLTLTNLQAADAGSYDVVISDASGSVTSNTSSLTVINSALSVSINSASIKNGVVTLRSVDPNAPASARIAYAVTEAHGVSLVESHWLFDGIEDSTWLNSSGNYHLWYGAGPHTVSVTVKDGTGTTASASTTVHVVSDALAAGHWHTCALTNTNGVRCWGYGAYGQLGDGVAYGTNGLAQYSSTPVSVNLSNVVGLAAAYHHTCAVRSDGTVWCWGDNFTGELGNGSDGSNLPVNVPEQVTGINNAVAVSASYTSTCALLSTHAVSCWGDPTQGQLGNGRTRSDTSSGNFATPQAVSGLTDAIAITSGYGKFSCALRSGGTVVCWGDNTGQEVGTGGTTTYYTTPQTVVTASGPVLDKIIAISAGNSTTCALRNDGTFSVWCWGAGGATQGHATSSVPSAAEQISGLTGIAMLSVGSEANHFCTTDVSDTLRCWGSDVQGESTGASHSTTSISVPAMVTGISAVSTGTSDAVAAGGFNYSCTLQSEGKAVCWGQGDSGELGNGQLLNTPTPQVVQGSTAWWNRGGH